MLKTILSVFSLSVLICGCADFPNDQHGSTARIRQSGIIVVGISRENDGATPFEERERRLVEKIAARLNARIRLVREAVMPLDWRLQHAAIEFTDDLENISAVLTRKQLEIEPE